VFLPALTASYRLLPDNFFWRDEEGGKERTTEIQGTEGRSQLDHGTEVEEAGNRAVGYWSHGKANLPGGVDGGKA